MPTEPTRQRDGAKPRHRFRSAVTGHFVTRIYAEQHPRETIQETVK